MVDTFQSDQLWDAIQSGCHSMLDHDSKLARQAKAMVEAEIQEDPVMIGEAALEFFYGDVEDAENHRRKRDSGVELGMGDWMEMVGELLQQEYFLHHFREGQMKQGSRKKRQTSGTMGGILSDMEENSENDDEQDIEEDEEQLYATYLADVAYFFPMLDFYIPFNGTYNFLQQQYSLFSLPSKKMK